MGRGAVDVLGYRCCLSKRLKACIKNWTFDRAKVGGTWVKCLLNVDRRHATNFPFFKTVYWFYEWTITRRAL